MTAALRMNWAKFWLLAKVGLGAVAG